MPRVHQQKANKDYPEHGIKKGETYYKWKFRYGGVRMSKTRPRPSQLTLSRWADVYAAQEAIEDAKDWDDLVDAIEEACSTIEQCSSEYEEAAEHFNNEGPNQERHEHLEDLLGELQNIDLSPAEDEEDEEQVNERIGEVRDAALDLDWDNPV